MKLTKGQVNTVTVTLYEKTTIVSPTYLFEFKGSETNGYKYCLAGNELSTHLTRYNQFEIEETGNADPLLYQVNLSEGQYSYSVYELTEEQAGDLDFDNVDSTLYGCVEGPCICRVTDSTNNTNTEYTASVTNTIYE